MMHLATIGLCILCWCGCVAPASAHKASDAYLFMRDTDAQSTALQLSISLKDLDAVFDALDANNDRQLTWGEIKRVAPEVAQWVGDGIAFTCGDPSDK